MAIAYRSGRHYQLNIDAEELPMLSQPLVVPVYAHRAVREDTIERLVVGVERGAAKNTSFRVGTNIAGLLFDEKYFLQQATRWLLYVENTGREQSYLHDTSSITMHVIVSPSLTDRLRSRLFNTLERRMKERPQST